MSNDSGADGKGDDDVTLTWILGQFPPFHGFLIPFPLIHTHKWTSVVVIICFIFFFVNFFMFYADLLDAVAFYVSINCNQVYLSFIFSCLHTHNIVDA